FSVCASAIYDGRLACRALRSTLDGVEAGEVAVDCGDHELDQWTDAEGVDEGADADAAAEEPAGGQDRHLDGGADRSDGPAGAADQASHQAMTRAGAHARADVEDGGGGVEHDGREHGGDPHRQ